MPPQTKVELLYVKGKMVEWKCIYSDGTEQIFAVNQNPPRYVLKLIAEAERPPIAGDGEVIYLIDPNPKYTGYMPPEFNYRQFSTQNKNVKSNAVADKKVYAPPAEITFGMKNALEKARQYLDTTLAFSYEGLLGQLKHDGYSDNEAEYAVQNSGANWREQAVKAAKNYLGTMPFSRSDLIKQLIHDKFTQEQANYGVEQSYR
ncbi:MAG: Ltp family lipoprotein [Synergistaceae bacterium]|nr:Ltp family lipoprotein [Synergistaceae bacterium]